MKGKAMLEKSISFKVTQAEYESLKKKADEEERPLGQIIRRAVRKYINEEMDRSS